MTQAAQPGTAQKITMRVYVKSTQYYGNNRTDFILATNEKVFATISYDSEDHDWMVEYWSNRNGQRHHQFHVTSYAEATECVAHKIEKYFATYGIDVEFVNE